MRGLKKPPAVMFVGCTLNPTLAAAPSVTLNTPDVAPVRPVLAAVSV